MTSGGWNRARWSVAHAAALAAATAISAARRGRNLRGGRRIM